MRIANIECNKIGRCHAEGLHNEELTDLHSSPNTRIIRLIKSRRMRWAGHVACMGRGEVYIGFWWENLRERSHLEDPGVDGRIIFRWIFRKWDGSMNWIDVPQNRDGWRALVNAAMNIQVP
jgi:hypothetical protein